MNRIRDGAVAFRVYKGLPVFKIQTDDGTDYVMVAQLKDGNEVLTAFRLFDPEFSEEMLPFLYEGLVKGVLNHSLKEDQPTTYLINPS